MHGFRRWLNSWSQRRAEKNRRFKIPCHLGVTGITADSMETEQDSSDRMQNKRHSDRRYTRDIVNTRTGKASGRHD